MRKTFKFKLKTYKSVETKLNHWLWLCKELYNQDLRLRIDSYEANKKSSFIHLPTFKKEHPDYKLIPSQILQDTQQRLNKAFDNFFRRIKNHEETSCLTKNIPNS